LNLVVLVVLVLGVLVLVVQVLVVLVLVVQVLVCVSGVGQRRCLGKRKER